MIVKRNRPTNINGHLKLYESRYIFIANHIIDLFNQGKLDILFIQEADSKFLEIFKMVNQSLKFKYHFISGKETNICLMTIYNHKYNSFGSESGPGFDRGLVLETQDIYHTINPDKGLRALPLLSLIHI